MTALELLYKIRLDPDRIIEKPPTLFSIVQKNGPSTEHISVFSRGDLSLLQGKQKSKKTYLTTAISVALLNNNVFPNMVTNIGDAKIAYFDTEQSTYYAQLTNRRIKNLACTKAYDYFAMRELIPIQRKELIELYLQTEPSCAFIVIDGIVDLLNDFNDLRECTEVVQWIMRLTKEHDVHCLTILHENPGSDKARGHIGSMLAQKAESVIKVERHETYPNKSVVSAKDTRGRSFNNFDILIDANGNPQFSESEETFVMF